MSAPTIWNWLVPGCSGTAAVQLVRVVQVTGQVWPLNQTAFTSTGATPEKYATLLVTDTLGLTEKAGASTAASCAAMLVWAWPIHGKKPVAGFSTLRPSATNALYLALESGEGTKKG